ncbi:hypothetical protein DPMN_129984 [Dreissena polymorpha]|uniref:Uncharacterized protein n=1 Tax=Dreissena polymorpha TaxID=45954 RepID=A0A9D4JX64_DREPO|nr:hypothetical protein DPMN_129984 [Dreissena polymorpha]
MILKRKSATKMEFVRSERTAIIGYVVTRRWTQKPNTAAMASRNLRLPVKIHFAAAQTVTTPSSISVAMEISC